LTLSTTSNPAIPRQVNCQAKFLKFTIGSGWGDFASVHRVSVF
jgi:hypothetical protein